jgi:hypothetical protein
VLEAHPDWVVLKLDIKNFYNEGDRHMALTAHKQGIADGNIVMEKDYFMLYYNLSVHEAPIYESGGQWLGFNSSIGGQQGCAMSTRTQCLHLRRMMGENEASTFAHVHYFPPTPRTQHYTFAHALHTHCIPRRDEGCLRAWLFRRGEGGPPTLA